MILEPDEQLHVTVLVHHYTDLIIGGKGANGIWRLIFGRGKRTYNHKCNVRLELVAHLRCKVALLAKKLLTFQFIPSSSRLNLSH
jgi:hypothetical protein